MNDAYPAAVMQADGGLAVRSVLFGPVGRRTVRASVAAAVACSTDAIARRAEFPVFGAPQIRGHGAVGTVREVGPDVRRVREGDRVIAAVRPDCGVCEYCVRGQAEWCAQADGPPMSAVPLVTGGEATERSWVGPEYVGVDADTGERLSSHARVGAYSPVMQVPDITLVRVDSDLPDGVLALLACGAGTGLGAALGRTSVGAGSSVLVVGCGVVGLSVISAARLRGAGRILAVDPIAGRRERALLMGADEVADPSDIDLRDWVLSRTRAQGVDTAFEACGTAQGMRDAFVSARRGGVVVLTGFGSPTAEVSLPMNELATRGKTVMGCQYGATQLRRDLPRLIALLESGRLDLDPLLDAEYGLTDINRALDEVENHVVVGAVIRPGGTS